MIANHQTRRRAAIYCRVSTDTQAEEGVSLESQKAAGLERFAKLQKDQPDLAECRTFVDGGYSAFKMQLFERPAGREMNEWLQPGDQVIMLRMERGFRSSLDWLGTLADWTRRGITLRFIHGAADPDTPDGKLLLLIQSALAEYDSAIKSARVREAIAWQQANGLYRGGRLKTGHKRAKDGSQVLTGFEAALARLVGYYRACGWSYARCADRIEQMLADREGRLPSDGVFSPRVWNKDRLYRLHKGATA